MNVTWKQTNEHQWLSSDGRRVQFSPSSQAFLVFDKRGYLGKDTTLSIAQQRITCSPTYLQDVEGAIPAFLFLSSDERAAARGKVMTKTPAPTVATAFTIEHLTKEYNRLAADALTKGLNYKPVVSFATLELAQASLDTLQSSLRANAASSKATVNQKEPEPKKVVAKSKAGGTSSLTEEGNTGTGPAKVGDATGAPPKERSTMSKKTAKKATAKTSKKATAKVAKTAKKAATNGARTVVADDAKCSVVGANPFREGTIRYLQLEMVRKGNVAAFVKAGGDRAYLSWFVRNGHAKAG